jgi:hypothetical protein
MDNEIEKTYFPSIFLIFLSVSSHLNVCLFCLKMVVEKGLKKENVSLESPESKGLIGFSLLPFKLKI